MKSSGFGIASCILLGLEVAWCVIVIVGLSIMGRGSFWSFNQSFVVLSAPVVELLSLIGFICGLAGTFAPDKKRISSVIGASINGIVLLTLSVLAFRP